MTSLPNSAPYKRVSARLAIVMQWYFRVGSALHRDHHLKTDSRARRKIYPWAGDKVGSVPSVQLQYRPDVADCFPINVYRMSAALGHDAPPREAPGIVRHRRATFATSGRGHSGAFV